MRAGRRGERRDADFDLTPMIDVVLLLIIFFMLSSQFVQTQLRPVPLPRESGEATPAKRVSLIIDLDAQGAASILGVPLPLDRLAEALGAVRPARPAGVSVADGSTPTPGDDPGTPARPTVIVRAHRECSAAHLNTLARALAALGVREWRLATAPPEVPKDPGADEGGTQTP